MFDQFKTHLAKHFTLNIKLDTEFFTYEHKKEERIIFIKAESYIDEVIKDCGLTEAKTAPTPSITGLKIEDCLAENIEDRNRHYKYVNSVIGKLRHLSKQVPDILYALLELSLIQHNPGKRRCNPSTGL